MNTRALLLSALIAGLVMALLSNIPVLNFVNCILCGWVWLSGIFAVYLYRRFAAPNMNLSNGQGLAVGALAGVVGAIIGSIVGAIFSSILGAGMASAFSLLASQPGFESYAPYLRTMSGGGGFSLFTLGCDLVFYVIFGAIGGLIATALIWKPQPAV
jgi:hypothetical protein